MDLTRADVVVQFTQGTTVWNNVNVPVPAGVVVIDTLNKIIKEGDGTTLFANLPACLDYNFQAGTSGAAILEGDDVGHVVICDDQTYTPSATTLESILLNIASKQSVDTAQQTRIEGLVTDTSMIVEISEGVVDGTIVVCQNGQYVPGDKTLTQMIADLVIQANVSETGMHIDDLEWYTDSGLTNRVVKPNQVSEGNTYWCKITGFHDNCELENVDFGLATTTEGVTVTNAINQSTSGIISAIYGGDVVDQFESVTTDSQDNIICAGKTNSEGLGTYEALVVKFNPNLEIIARKRYGGSGIDQFESVTTDSQDNIICVGYTQSEGTEGDALVVKFNPNLEIIARKRYGGSGADYFYGVATDSQDNIICVGWTYSVGTSGNGDASIVKFDPDLNISIQKYYGGSGFDRFHSITTDSQDNIICAGSTTSEGTATEALVVKFNYNLIIIARKRYGGSADEQFYSVATDSQDNIICAGYTASAGSVSNDAIVVKFNSNLSVIVSKIYNGGDNEYFYNVATDSQDNIICVGSGVSLNKALIIKFDSMLGIYRQKSYGGGSGEYFYGVTTDSQDNIICAGATNSEGSGGDALALKLPPAIPTGTFTGTILTGLTLTDSTLTVINSTLTLADSTLTLANGILTSGNSILTLADSTRTLERDVIVAGRIVVPTTLITSVYSSAFVDEFRATITDSVGNVFAVGMTTINGTANALIVKFDSEFNVITRKLYTGAYSNNFNSVAVDASDNVIGIGKYNTISGGATEAFIVKFDNDLATVISHKTYGATGDDVFNDIAVSAAGNYYVVGYTTSEGIGLKECLVVKFNSSLTILYKKRYGGSGNDVLNGVAMDANGNAICVGSTASEGANTSGIILKLDSNLNVVLRKYYNSTLGTGTEFNAVAVTSANIMYCVGRVIVGTGNKGLIVKFDASLNTTGNKLYGSTTGSTEFTGIALDSGSNIIIAGKTNAEGAGNYDALIMKLSSALAMLGRKTYGTIGEDANIDVSIDPNDKIILSGYSVIGDSTDAVVTQLPNDLPTGVYTNKYITDLILSDSKLTLSDDNATVLSSALTMADSALVLTNSAMSIEEAAGAVIKDVTIMDAMSNIFKVRFGDIVSGVSLVNVPFIATTNDGDETVTKTMSVDVSQKSIIAAIYGGGIGDYFNGVAVDSEDNIICVGYSASEGTSSSGIVIKFDPSLNIIYKKFYNGSSADYFQSVTTDSQDNIICVGISLSGSVGSSAIVVKFDKDLGLTTQKKYDGPSGEYFYGVTTDSQDNIICVGYTTSEGSGGDPLVIKFDKDLTIITRKYCSGGIGESSFRSVITDSQDNIICAGYTSEGSSGGALIMKFDSALAILYKKYYGGTYAEGFEGVAVDSHDNIICVGYTVSEGTGVSGIVIKFNPDLTISARKRYTGTSQEYLYGVTIDSQDNIICTGHTNSEGAGDQDCLILKFNSALSMIYHKRYGGTGQDHFFSGATDSQNNIICAGGTVSEGMGSNDCLVLKLPSAIPAGTLTGTVLTALSLSDSTLTLADSTLTLGDSVLTATDSALTLSNNTLTINESNLTFEKDLIDF